VNILAMDTATPVLSLALESRGELWSASADAGLRHSEILMDMMDGLLRNAGLEAADLEAVACMKGPGSFTGLRIGFAAAKGLALALGIPLAAESTLDCMARPFAFWPGAVLPVIDAKKGRFFVSLYKDGSRLTGFMDAGVREIADTVVREGREKGFGSVILTGPGAGMIYPDLAFLVPGVNFRSGEWRRQGWGIELLEEAKKHILNSGTNDVNGGPEYLRKSDAELQESPPGLS
jgi:tRNA threonylcarbamoyladenosine biosynthesis protein TsaB